MNILFDLDGTLVDVRSSYHQAIGETVRHFGGEELKDEEIRQCKAQGGYNNDWDLTECLLRRRSCTVSYEAIVAVFQRVYWGEEGNGLIGRERWLLNPECLRQLGRRHALGIVTGRPRREALWTLDHFAVRNFFSVLVAHDDCPKGRGKPDPYGIDLALSQMASKGRGIYIGDSPDDRDAALAAGLEFIGVMPPGMEYPGFFAGFGGRILRDINRIQEAIS